MTSTASRTGRRAARMDEALLREITSVNRSGGGSWSQELLARAGASSSGAAARAVAFLVTAMLAMLAALPFVYLSGADGQLALEALVVGSWGSPTAIAETLVQAIPLMISGLAVAVAFHAGLFNIGVEGQLVVGALAAGVVGATVPLPAPLLLAACIAAGVVGGALWALVPALLKALRGVHEVVTTIMMNYIAFAVSTYLVSPAGPFVSATQPSATERIDPEARLGVLLPGTRLHAGLLVAVVVAVIFAWVLYRTPYGFGVRLTGANPPAAAASGVSVRRTMITAMLASGALAGLAGAVQVLGLFGRYFDAFSPGYGFDAIAVALLGALAPVGIAIAALFFGTLDSGAVYLQAVAGVSREMVGVVSGLVIGFVAAQPAVLRLLRSLRARRRHRPGVLDTAWDEAVPAPLADENAAMSRGLAEEETR